MAEDQSIPPRGRPAVFAGDDLDVRPADADGQGLDQDRTVLGRGLGHVVETGGAGGARQYGQGSHGDVRSEGRWTKSHAEQTPGRSCGRLTAGRHNVTRWGNIARGRTA